MCEKHCGDCSRATLIHTADIGVATFKRGCNPPFPFSRKVLSDAACIRPDDPKYFSPATLIIPKKAAVAV